MINLKLDEYPTVSLLTEEPKEPTIMNDYGLTADLEAEIMQAGAEIGAAKTGTKASPKGRRKKATEAAWAAANAGQMPARLIFPASAPHRQKHADAMLAMAEANDRAGLEAHVITGTANYSNTLRSYKDALLTFLSKPIALPKPKAAKK